MNLSSSKSFLKRFWHLLTGLPEEREVFYFKKMENVEMSVDWQRRRIDFQGKTAQLATDYEEVFIKHMIRLSQKGKK